MFEESPFTGACTFATLEVISMLIGTLLLGVLLGYLIWGWTKRKLELVQKELDEAREENASLRETLQRKESIERRTRVQSAVVTARMLRSKREESRLAKKLTLTAAREASLIAKFAKNDPVETSSPVGITPVVPRSAPSVKNRVDDQFLAEPEDGVELNSPDVDALKKASKIMGRKVEFNDLTLIEGVGPRIAEVLRQSGITSWDILARQTKHVLRVILDEAGPEFRVHKPKTWPRQARMAADGEWRKLKTYQDVLNGGV